jgi:hypothetical protein
MDPSSAEWRFQGRELELSYLVQNRVSDLSKDTQRHFKEGIARRLELMRTSRVRILEIAAPGRTKGLSLDETAEINVDVNSYYVQLRGALDNLAWALHYQYGLLGPGDEASLDIRRKCDLFGRSFLAALEKVLPGLAAFCRERLEWATELKTLRDPIAHRIPLYAAPGVVQGDEFAKVQALHADADAAFKAGDREVGMAKIREAREVGRFHPVIVTSSPTGLTVLDLHHTIGRDQSMFLDIAEATCNAMNIESVF